MVISHVAMHHLPNPTLMLREVGRVLKPKGAFLIRDLKRPPNRIVLELYVRIFGGGGAYDATQKKLYRDSLMAGFTANELRQMADEAGLQGFTVKKYFITHVGIERRAPDATPGPKPSLKGLKAGLMHRLYRR
jgi:ubiquinone/menaquinone biosynthesis C-methylase UbiE